MKYEFHNMSQEQAEIIAFSWHYEGDYAFYNMEADPEDLMEFLDKNARGDSAFAVTSEEELIAFLCVSTGGRNAVDIGIGMKPELTGKGLGLSFITAAADFVQIYYKPDIITLSVAAFNQRAINVYRKFGFTVTETYMQQTNGSLYEFVKMEYSCI